MGTEVWFRNPSNYIRELVEVGEVNVVWDRGLVLKRKIDPYKHAEIYFGARKDWRVMLVGSQGTCEIGYGRNVDNPIGVYPTWDAATESLDLLEEMMAYPLGDDPEVCSDSTVQTDERPVYGQVHRVLVINIPSLVTGPGRSLILKLNELQEDYPDCILHLHNLYSWRVSFGMSFRSSDIDPRTAAGKGKVILPNGKEMIAERTVSMSQWVTLLGMKPIDLTNEPRNRTIYNIKSAMWASEHFKENVAFKSRGSTPSNLDTTSKKVAPVTTTLTHSRGASAPSLPVQPNDKLQCDTCSMQTSCKYYRQGSVCSVPGSEPAELAKFFNTRDSNTIIQGLGTVLALQTRRLEKGVREEETFGELDPEVTKIANQIFTNGTKLAKLVNPELNGGPKVQVNVGAGAAAVQAGTPNQMMAGILAEFESRGIPRSEVTPEMIKGLLAEMSGQGGARELIQGQVIANES